MTLDPTVQLAVAEAIKFCESSIYPEPPGGVHADIIPGVWNWVKGHDQIKLTPGDRIVDIGPGTGQAMDLFQKDDLNVVGISASREECERLNGDGSGKVCLYMDMHEISRMSRFANGIWARHVLEHSFMPLVMLRGMKQALKPGGWAYIEIPSPLTASQHWSNANHFSCLTAECWRELILRSGFKLIDIGKIEFENLLGPDTYHNFLVVNA